MSKTVIYGATVAALLQLSAIALPSSASAATVFSDDFNSYGLQLNWAPPANWTAPGPGAVDLIGSGGVFDFYSGNGRYVDLHGSNGTPGTLQTIATFAPGAYKLTFDLGGNARGDVDKTTAISLGDFATSITLASGAGLLHESYSFTTTGGRLAFSDQAQGNGNIGNILDNVKLAAVPEPATWAMMLVGLGGLGAAMRRQRQTALAV